MKENLYFKELNRDTDSYAGLKNQHLPQHKFCDNLFLIKEILYDYNSVDVYVSVGIEVDEC